MAGERCPVSRNRHSDWARQVVERREDDPVACLEFVVPDPEREAEDEAGGGALAPHREGEARPLARKRPFRSASPHRQNKKKKKEKKAKKRQLSEIDSESLDSE